LSDPFLGEIRIVGFPYAPRGYAQCLGQRIPIAQNAALFSLLGTYYGGDGQQDFALPDLRGRAPVGSGQTPGRSAVGLGEAVSLGEAGDGRNGLGLNFVIALEGITAPRA
jgi:microcystin-dependent protein